MIKAIGFSVLTQLLASGGNFVVSILMLRFLSLDDFGSYVYCYLLASLGLSLAVSATGLVYQFCVPRLSRLRRSYEREYNGFNLIVTAAIALAISVATTQSMHFDGASSAAAISIFTLSVIAFDNLKLQATANGQHALMFRVEAVRQASLIAAMALLGWLGESSVLSFILAHGLTGLVACALMMFALDWRPRFRRLDWVWQKHLAYARHLVPSTVISALHGTVVQLLAARHFGLEAVGALRTAELPFSALNPVKQSLNFFLPRAIYHFDLEAGARKREMVVKLGLLIAATIALATFALWLLSQPLFPLLTHKVYPASIGVFYAAAYVAMTMVSFLNHYLNTVRMSASILHQNVLGAIVALAVYFGLSPWIGVAAAPAAILACSLAMAIVGALHLARHINRGQSEEKPGWGSPGSLRETPVAK